MNYNSFSLLHPTCWPLSFTLRLICCIICCFIGFILLLLPRNRKFMPIIISYFIYTALFLVIIGLDITGHPVENLFGFRSIESANYYSSKGTVVSTVEGNDSTLVVSEKKAILENETYIVGDITVYTKGNNGWKAVNYAIKKKQIAVEYNASNYLIYILKEKGSSDEYLIICDLHDNAEAITCWEVSEFNYYKESTGLSYWFARCNGSVENSELRIEIHEKDGVNETILFNTGGVSRGRFS